MDAGSLKEIKKIFLCGISGAGKTTLATNLSEKFGHRPIYMDEHFWLENRKQMDLDDFYSRIDRLALCDLWVLECIELKNQKEIDCFLSLSNE